MQLLDGYTKLEGCSVTTATPTAEIVENIKLSLKRNVPNLHDMDDWREQMPIAIVGGGPSLKNTLEELKKYKYIMACGSVHDFLAKNNIVPNWCVICDPDPLLLEYTKLVNKQTKYLIASQCSPAIFDYFIKDGINTYMWHAAGDQFDNTIFGEKTFALGGGCTVATRAMVLAMAMGYYNIHMFGMDTCIINNEHHAYDFVKPEIENHSIADVYEIQLDLGGPKFQVAGYMLGQLFDFKQILKNYATKIDVTIHGDGLLAHLMKLAREKSLEQEVKENG